VSDNNIPAEPPPETPEEKAEREVMALYRAALDAGVRRGDPANPLIVGLGNYGRWLSRERTAMEGVFTRGIARFDAQFDRRYRDDGHYVDRLKAEVDRVYSDVTIKVADKLMKEIGTQARKLALSDARKSFARQTIAAVVLTAACLTGGWYGGQHYAAAEYAQFETALHRAVSRDGSDRAKIWLELIRDNDPKQALEACVRDGRSSVQNGQPMCLLAMWTGRQPLPSAY
jgi:hypothetical protein